MSRSLESETPISTSWSRRCRRSAEADWTGSSSSMCAGTILFDTDCAYLLDVGYALQNFFYAVLLKGAHAVVESGRKHLSNARVLLDITLDPVGADLQLVKSGTALVTGAGAYVAA